MGSYLRNIEESVQEIDDPHALDRVNSLLMQAPATLKPINRCMEHMYNRKRLHYNDSILALLMSVSALLTKD